MPLSPVTAEQDTTLIVFSSACGRPIRGQAEAAQPLCFFSSALPRQQLSDPFGVPIVPIARSGAGAQDLHGPVQIPPLSQQVGQPPGCDPVAGVGAGAQLVQVPAPGQQAGQLPGGIPVAGV